MKLTDTHAHLYLKEFNNKGSEIIEKAINLGVERIFLPNIDSSTIKSMMKLAGEFPKNCFPMIGLHPGSVKNNFEEELEIIKASVQRHEFCAIGEIGIDLYWDKTHSKQQEIAFREQVKWAKEMKLPVVIHSREAFKEVFKIMDELNDKTLKGIFHCFTGTIEQAKKIISYRGFKLGIGGVVTFKNAGLDKVVEQIDPEHIVLETDSPYLAPVPYRGKRNESAYLLYIAGKVADLHNISVEKVAEITTCNSVSIFNK